MDDQPAWAVHVCTEKPQAVNDCVYVLDRKCISEHYLHG